MQKTKGEVEGMVGVLGDVDSSMGELSGGHLKVHLRPWISIPLTSSMD